MCGIAGIIYKDKKTHNVGKSLTSMLESLQHRGPDSAGFAIYGGLNLQKNNYQLNIEVKNRPELLKQIKNDENKEKMNKYFNLGKNINDFNANNLNCNDDINMNNENQNSIEIQTLKILI